MDTIEYRVNEVAQETKNHVLTPREILQHAEIDADLHFLEETQPAHISFQDNPDEPINMVPQMRFKAEHQLIHYKVNDENEDTRHRRRTPRQIMTQAGIDPATNYLSEVFPHHLSFEGKPDEPIDVHQGMRFISVSIKPTPVSGC